MRLWLLLAVLLAGCAARGTPRGPALGPSGPGVLEVLVLDVGLGDATLVTSPRGDTLLIDGGPVGPGLAGLLTELRRRGLQIPDHLVVTHYDPEHLGGIAYLLAGPDSEPDTPDDPRPPGVLLDYGQDFECPLLECIGYSTLAEGLAVTARVGDTIDLGDGVRARVVAAHGTLEKGGSDDAADANGRGLAVLLEAPGFRALFAGDLPEPLLGRLAERVGEVDLLLVPAHGAAGALSEAAAAALSPEVAVVSVGANESCLPDPALLEMLAATGAAVWVTAWPERRGCEGGPRPDAVLEASGHVVIRAGESGVTVVGVGLDGRITLEPPVSSAAPPPGSPPTPESAPTSESAPTPESEAAP